MLLELDPNILSAKLKIAFTQSRRANLNGMNGFQRVQLRGIALVVNWRNRQGSRRQASSTTISLLNVRTAEGMQKR
jgi:hypothetical protein